MPHRYERFEDTPLWRALEDAVGELVDNNDVELRTDKVYVISLLCNRLEKANVLNSSADQSTAALRARFAAFLDSVAAGGRHASTWQEAMTTHFGEPAVEEARQQASLTAIRLDRGDITNEQAAEYFRSLARRLRDQITNER